MEQQTFFLLFRNANFEQVLKNSKTAVIIGNELEKTKPALPLTQFFVKEMEMLHWMLEEFLSNHWKN